MEEVIGSLHHDDVGVPPGVHRRAELGRRPELVVGSSDQCLGAGVVSGVHLDGTSAYSLGSPSYAPLPAGTPDMTAVWDGKLSRDQAETRPFLDHS